MNSQGIRRGRRRKKGDHSREEYTENCGVFWVIWKAKFIYTFQYVSPSLSLNASHNRVQSLSFPHCRVHRLGLGTPGCVRCNTIMCELRLPFSSCICCVVEGSGPQHHLGLPTTWRKKCLTLVRKG